MPALQVMSVGDECEDALFDEGARYANQLSSHSGRGARDDVLV